jgi:hypothetical protein
MNGMIDSCDVSLSLLSQTCQPGGLPQALPGGNPAGFYRAFTLAMPAGVKVKVRVRVELSSAGKFPAAVMQAGCLRYEMPPDKTQDF